MKINISLLFILSINCFIFSQNESSSISSKEKIDSAQVSNYKSIELDTLKFNDVENPPLAPDCKSKWKVLKRKECTRKYINRYITTYFDPGLAVDLPRQRIKINIEFIIDTFGKPVNITATGGPEIINKNVIEVISKLPNLEPGTVNGRPVNVFYQMPLLFYIQ